MSLLLGIIYLSFISLGLPDALLGAAWPDMYPEFQVPVSYAGMISMIIAFGTIISSLQSDRLTKKFGTGKVTAVSVGITAFALWGFSISHSFWMLCLWAIPYGLGAGSVDASLNNYVALHYASKHMSWLHCMWGVGATLGPYIMGAVLTGGATWNSGYRIISLLQIVLTAVLVFSFPKWKKQSGSEEEQAKSKSLSLREIIAIPGAKAIMLCFFCYCAVEQTTMLWASSYLNLAKGVDAEIAASFAGMFCIGITIGRGINGFIAMKLKDAQMIRMDGTGNYFCGNPDHAASFWKNRFSDWIFPDRTWLCAGISMYHSFHTGTFWSGTFPGNHWGADGKCLHRNLSDAATVWSERKSHIYPVIAGISADPACVNDIYA